MHGEGVSGVGEGDEVVVEGGFEDEYGACGGCGEGALDGRAVVCR